MPRKSYSVRGGWKVRHNFDRQFARMNQRVKQLVQGALNDMAKDAAKDCEQMMNDGVKAEGPKKGYIHSDSGAMAHGYYYVAHGNGSVHTNYEEAAAASFENGSSKLEPPVGMSPYTINANTQKLYAGIGNATAHGNYWESGHRNYFIDKNGKYARAEVMQAAMFRIQQNYRSYIHRRFANSSIPEMEADVI